MSYFTPTYEEEALGLARSLGLLGLPARIEKAEDQGSWHANCLLKPMFLLGALRACGGPVCWLDADARVVRRPAVILDGLVARADVAFHRFNGNVISSCVFFNDTPASHRLLNAWWSETQRRPAKWDQVALRDVLRRNPWPDLRVEELPAEYCWIDDVYERTGWARDAGPPVIVQRQASRRLAGRG